VFIQERQVGMTGTMAPDVNTQDLQASDSSTNLWAVHRSLSLARVTPRAKTRHSPKGHHFPSSGVRAETPRNLFMYLSVGSVMFLSPLSWACVICRVPIALLITFVNCGEGSFEVSAFVAPQNSMNPS